MQTGWQETKHRKKKPKRKPFRVVAVWLDGKEMSFGNYATVERAEQAIEQLRKNQTYLKFVHNFLIERKP